jgi:hypothetical protein
MKDILFWGLLIVILFSILYVSQFNIEGFEPQLKIPATNPPRESLTSGDFSAYTPPSFALLSPPPGGVASVNALPRIDPSMEKSPYARIKELLESANGFIQIEAPKMAEMSDPSVQLPLTTLRSDIRRLEDEDLVLQRNPGIDSTLTQNDVDGMYANLVYLQKKWRETANSTSGIEGFADASGNADPSQNRMASLSQLKDLVVRITVEMSRLSGSATSNPTTNARLETLKKIKQSIQDIIEKVNAKTLAEKDIRISESSYKSFLPVLGTSGALPDILKEANLPPTLSSLFPAALGDISGAEIARYLFDNYSKTLFKGLSWDINYTSERSLEIANAKKEFAVAAKSGLVGKKDNAMEYGSAPSTDYRGEFSSKTSPGMGTMNGTTSMGATGMGATSKGMTSTGKPLAGPPATFDWKERSIAICSAVEKRGYNPGDFGCLEDVNRVGQNFSWRGYAKMVCSRIATIYDTGAPEACGCPPPTWAGWRP